MKTIYLASAIIIDQQNRFLTVRKKGSSYFMMAGGKIESNETPQQALLREIEEELALTIKTNDITFLGTHETLAVNEKETVVHAHIYQILLTNETVQNCAEIEEIKWLTEENYTDVKLARLLSEFSLPIWLDILQKNKAIVNG